jgi:hypothetical protein
LVFARFSIDGQASAFSDPAQKLNFFAQILMVCLRDFSRVRVTNNYPSLQTPGEIIAMKIRTGTALVLLSLCFQTQAGLVHRYSSTTPRARLPSKIPPAQRMGRSRAARRSMEPAR